MRAFEKLAVKRFNEGVLAEEAVTHVVEGLSADDWARCRAFKGQSKPTTFLYSLASNLIEEFARKRFGRPRPPTWLQEQGELWVQMWKYLCLERQLLPSIVDRLSANNAREPGFLEHVARTIKARMPNCGATTMDAETTEDIQYASDVRQSEEYEAQEAEFAGEHAAVTEIVLMLRSVLDEAPDGKHFSEDARSSARIYARGQAEAMARFRELLTLNDEEKVLLRMIFVDGFSKSAASRALGLPAHQAGRVANAALARIGDAMRGCGIDFEDLMEKV